MSGDLEARSVAAALWQRTAARCKDDLRRVYFAGRGDDAKAAVTLQHVEHSRIGDDRDAGADGGCDQRIQHVARSVRIGKQLSVMFFVQGHTELVEKRDG